MNIQTQLVNASDIISVDEQHIKTNTHTFNMLSGFYVNSLSESVKRAQLRDGQINIFYDVDTNLVHYVAHIK